MGGVGWALLGDRVFVVRSVTVTGTHLLADAQVIAAARRPAWHAAAQRRRRGRDAPGGGDPRGGVRHRDGGLAGPRGHRGHRAGPRHGGPDGGRRLRPGGPDRGDRALAQAKPAALPVLVTSLAGSALRGNPAVAAAADVLAELQPWLARQVAAGERRRGAGRARAGDA